jgi:integrase
VAYEAADSGLLSPELAAGIRRVKGVRRIGVRLGNWLTADQGRSLLLKSQGDNLRSKRNYAILALLIGCGLRRGELLALWVASIQLREEHWVIADLYGKAGHIRTVPIPLWVVKALRRVFRGKFIDGLKRLYRRKKLGRAGPAALFNEPKQFAKLLGRLRRQDWVVYAKPLSEDRCKYCAISGATPTASPSRIIVCWPSMENASRFVGATMPTATSHAL